ncbi:E3 ubiquitin-protein ligase RGLG2, partial [Camellia lanceoleosa]
MSIRRGMVEGGVIDDLAKNSNTRRFETGSTAQQFDGETVSSLLFGLEKISNRTLSLFPHPCSFTAPPSSNRTNRPRPTPIAVSPEIEVEPRRKAFNYTFRLHEGKANRKAFKVNSELDKRQKQYATDHTQVTEALAHAGLESCNLIVSIDYTKSNEWTGARSFNRRGLHYIGSALNPYEQAISIIGKTLVGFDEDNLIPCYGFGDVLCVSILATSTHDQDVFRFYPDDRFCNGFEEVLSQYREIVPHLRLAVTSFGRIIEMAMTIVEKSGGQYHVTRSVDTEHGHKLPLSIILVGVGDGPWDMAREFDDNIPARAFDNFQVRNVLERVPLPPPVYSAPSFSSAKSSCSSNFHRDLRFGHTRPQT